jgi:hypothetical protein
LPYGLKLSRAKHSSLFDQSSGKKAKKVYFVDTCGRFHKHFTRETYNLRLKQNNLYRLSTAEGCDLQFSNCTLAFIDTAVSFARKMFMTLAPGVSVTAGSFRSEWLKFENKKHYFPAIFGTLKAEI